jgi:nucleotide-binding universal stress UspA family protein
MMLPERLIMNSIASKARKEPYMNSLMTTNPIQRKTECVGTRFAPQDARECKPFVNPPQIQNILVAVDFSDYSEVALRYATFLAENFGATLTLIHSVEPYVYPEDLSAGFTIEQIDARWMQKQKEKLETVRQTIKEGIPATVVVTMGTAWNRIVGAAKSWNADLIVIGTHGRTGLKHALMGSTAERVVRRAACPVLVVHSPDKRPANSKMSEPV